MTDQEIDKWVEDHITYPEDSDIAPSVIEWGKIIAHKFYNLGREEGKKVVDYTVAFELEDKMRQPTNHLTVEDIKTILDISFWNDDPQKILDEYNRLHKIEA